MYEQRQGCDKREAPPILHSTKPGMDLVKGKIYIYHLDSYADNRTWVTLDMKPSSDFPLQANCSNILTYTMESFLKIILVVL